MEPFRILLIAGTAEARALAERLAGDPVIDLTISLAGVTSDPKPYPGRILSGGFSGVAGLTATIKDGRFALLIDAAHPFAAQMHGNVARAAADTGIAAFRLARPGWQAETGDRWTRVGNHDAAIRALGSKPRRVLLAIGRKEALLYRKAEGHAFLIRSVEPVEGIEDWPEARAILDRGPFDLTSERDLLVREGIEVIIAKDSGGTASRAKLDAARALGLEVILIDRPVIEGLATVGSVDEALAQIASIRRSAGY